MSQSLNHWHKQHSPYVVPRRAFPLFIKIPDLRDISPLIPALSPSKLCPCSAPAPLQGSTGDSKWPFTQRCQPPPPCSGHPLLPARRAGGETWAGDTVPRSGASLPSWATVCCSPWCSPAPAASAPSRRSQGARPSARRWARRRWRASGSGPSPAGGTCSYRLRAEPDTVSSQRRCPCPSESRCGLWLRPDHSSESRKQAATFFLSVGNKPPAQQTSRRMRVPALSCPLRREARGQRLKVHQGKPPVPSFPSLGLCCRLLSGLAADCQITVGRRALLPVRAAFAFQTRVSAALSLFPRFCSVRVRINHFPFLIW